MRVRAGVRHLAARLLSWGLIVCGAVLLVIGAETWFESQFAQSEEAESWRKAAAESHPVAEQHRDPSWTAQRGQAFAKLSIPRLGAEWYVMEGTGRRELRRGPGHVEGTAMPGEPGNAVIAGHRDTHFRVLKDIRQGDEIDVETPAGRHTYRVTKLSIVPPSDTRPLRPASGRVLNLVTCYPFYYVGPAPKRFIVRAEAENQVASEHQSVSREPLADDPIGQETIASDGPAPVVETAYPGQSPVRPKSASRRNASRLKHHR
jgi:sortase A